MSSIDQLFEKMWKDYIELNPQSLSIVNLLKNEGESIVNDHIALRTFNVGSIAIDQVSKPFLQAGYRECGEYEFTEKKLYAKHFEHGDSSMPKVFISQLIIENFSSDFQMLIKQKIVSVDEKFYAKEDLMVSGRPWDISSDEYFKLKNESDYAAWVASIGFRPNHFTISINHLKKYSDILALNTFLKENGFMLNAQGGEIKGSAEELLEQSSTLANNINIKFSDCDLEVPGCYFEFAKRYADSTGHLYQGFIAKSADKIFESTDVGQ